jgi:HTH-type transcriptional regulator, sugar sensing transcriptional regulator
VSLRGEAEAILRRIGGLLRRLMSNSLLAMIRDFSASGLRMTNHMTELKNELEHLGLSEKESRVYLAALEMGPSPVQDISHKAKVNRATTYVMIESLSSRGLMSTFQKGKKRFYAAESPERLKEVIDREKKTLAEKEVELMKAMPMLQALYNAEGAKPQVRYLEGVEGAEAVRRVFEKQKGDFVQVVPLDEAHKVEEMLHGRDIHVELLTRQGVKGRILVTMETPDSSQLPEAPTFEMRLISAREFPIHGEMSVRGNHVFLFSYKSARISVIIVSQEIADMLRALFDMAWEKKKTES